jgi:hypothetical protein
MISLLKGGVAGPDVLALIGAFDTELSGETGSERSWAHAASAVAVRMMQ